MEQSAAMYLEVVATLVKFPSGSNEGLFLENRIVLILCQRRISELICQIWCGHDRWRGQILGMYDLRVNL